MQKFQCVYCKKYFDDEAALICHFEDCKGNPKNKTCFTCADADCGSAYTFGCRRWVNEVWFCGGES